MISKEAKLVKSYLASIGFNVRVLKGFDTLADMNNGVIHFSKHWYNKKFKELQETSKVLKVYYKNKLKQDIKISMATYAVFHELGHLISLKDYENKNFQKAYAQYRIGIRKIKSQSIKKQMYEYRNLKLERLADKYAYAIYTLNEESAIAFDKIMRKQFAC